MDELQRRAVLYFWEKADPGTGLVNDRANNFQGDDYTAASTAATGYGLAALAIGVGVVLFGLDVPIFGLIPVWGKLRGVIERRLARTA